MESLGMGQSGNFHWWEGVVEDNLDPTGAGRCKVRVIIHNTPIKDGLSTVELPWAYPMMPLNNPHGKIVALKPGTRVTGFFRDDGAGQDYVMLGTINTGYGTALGFDETKLPQKIINIANSVPRVGDIGFVDDRAGVGSPIEDQPQKTIVKADMAGVLTHENASDYYPLVANEINTPRLARGVVSGTITEAHDAAQSNTFITKTDMTTIEEPPTPFNALYPYNTVEESDSGHLREVDDTPGAERIKETHRTGTFYEIHPDGTKVTKVVKDDFSVIIGNKGVKVSGNCAVHVVGQADFYCESDIKVKTEKNARVYVKNDMSAFVENDLVAKVLRDTLIRSEERIDIIAGGDMSIQAAAGEIVFSDSTATGSNVDEIIRDYVDPDSQGQGRMRVDLGKVVDDPS